MYGYNQGLYGNTYGANYGTNYNQQPTTDERIWVQNQTSAEAYLVAPNSFVRLWDSSLPRYYEKRADATGRPYPLEVYEYSRVAQNESLTGGKGNIDYTDEIKRLNERISALEKELKNVSKSNANDTTVQSVQTELQRESRGRGTETSSFGQNESNSAKPASEYGNRISETDGFY